MSVAEFVIAMALTSTLAGLLVVQYAFFTRSFARLQQYMYMGGKSRYAMDRISKDIRQADQIVSFSTNQVTILVNGTNVTFAYDPDLKQLNRTSAGKTELFLTGCDYLKFEVMTRDTATNTFVLPTATGTNDAKVVRMNWICSRQMFGAKTTTENIQSATVTMRHK